MKRPVLSHFTAIDNGEFLALRMSIIKKKMRAKTHFKGQAPWQSWPELFSKSFTVKINLLDAKHQIIHSKSSETDSFGNLSLRIPRLFNKKEVVIIQIFETSFYPGLECILGSFIPVKLPSPKKLIICDFDRTLVDTKYSTPKELFNSLSSPLSSFPTVPKSVDILKQFIEDDYTPFILSASPHFYESAIRDWLYQNGIFTNNIFLKDYRTVFSLFEGDLSPKDIKIQGFYKLNHLINILLMTEIPDQLVLIGDGFESDRLIYLTLYAILIDGNDPWMLWNQLKRQESFQLTNRQHSRFLSKIYQLRSMVLKKKPEKFEIWIRCLNQQKNKLSHQKLPLDFLQKNHHKVHYYES